MSQNYIYKLSGESEKRAKEFGKKRNEQINTLGRYLIDRWGLEEGQPYWMDNTSGLLRAIPINGDIPPEFKKCSRQKNMMEPKSTKAGNAITKEFAQYRVEWADNELISDLGLDKMQIVDGGRRMQWPNTMIVNGGAYLITGKPCDHPEATEIPYGEFERAVDAHNTKAKESQS